eukprot:augustus_masked-scaffold_17-processed-gene-6.4-mRNA-1 protein AED:1.00 eAED:1.00 QI:0/-1/0/0/-1/1/1/0/1136
MLKNYLPRVVLESLATGRNLRNTLNCVSIFADISGFTNLTESLGSLGDTENEKRGTEEIVTQINEYWSKIVPSLTESGADIIKFAGDALVVIYKVEVRMLEVMNQECTKLKRETANKDPFELVLNCLKRIAVKTCLSLQDDAYTKRHDFSPEFGLSSNSAKKKEELITLMIKYGIGCGTVILQHLGGISDGLMKDGKKEYLLVGEALRQSFQAESTYEGGETAISQTVYHHVTTFKRPSRGLSQFILQNRGEQNEEFKFSCTPCKEDSEGLRYYKVSAPNFLNDELHDVVKRWIDGGLTSASSAPRLSPNKILQYLPAALNPSLGQIGERKPVPPIWVNSLRQVTTLFCDLGLSGDTKQRLFRGDQNALDNLNELFKAIQVLVYLHEGSINKSCMDDKGYTLVIVFGLRPYTKQDISKRGAECSINLLKKLQQSRLNGSNLKPRIGLSTGTVFCGVTGATRVRDGRIEYSIIGGKVNFSAKIMSKIFEGPGAPRHICLDNATALATSPYKVSCNFSYNYSSTMTKGIGKVYPFMYVGNKSQGKLAKLQKGEIMCIISRGHSGRLAIGARYKRCKPTSCINEVVRNFLDGESLYQTPIAVYMYNCPSQMSVIPGVAVNQQDLFSSFALNPHVPAVWLTVMNSTPRALEKRRNIVVSTDPNSWLTYKHQWKPETVLSRNAAPRVTNTDIRKTNYGNGVSNGDPLCLYEFRSKLHEMFSNQLSDKKNVLYILGEPGVSFDLILQSVVADYPLTSMLRISLDYGLKPRERGESLWREIIRKLSNFSKENEEIPSTRGAAKDHIVLSTRESSQPADIVSLERKETTSAYELEKMYKEFKQLLMSIGNSVLIIDCAEALSSFSFKFLKNCLVDIAKSNLKIVLLVMMLPALRTTPYNHRGSANESAEETNISHRRRHNSSLEVTRANLSVLESKIQNYKAVESGVLIEYPEYTKQIIMDLVHAKDVPKNILKFFEKVTGGSLYKIQQLLLDLQHKRVLRLKRTVDYHKLGKSVVHYELKFHDKDRFKIYSNHFEIPGSCELMYSALIGSFGAFAEVLMGVGSLLRSFTKEILFFIVSPGSKDEYNDDWKNLVACGVFKVELGSYVIPDEWLKLSLRRTVLQVQKEFVKAKLVELDKLDWYDD